MNATATAWLVLQLTGSGVALGVNTGLLFLPILLIGAYGGVLADRFDKRKILMWTQGFQALISLALFALVATDVVVLWMVYATSLVSGLILALDNPTRQSFYVEMVGEDDLTNAVSLNSAVFMGSRVLGPALAGFLIRYGGPRVAVPRRRAVLPRGDRGARADAARGPPLPAAHDARAGTPHGRVPVRLEHARASPSAAGARRRVHVLVQLGGVGAAAGGADLRRRRRDARTPVRHDRHRVVRRRASSWRTAPPRPRCTGSRCSRPPRAWR